MAQYKAQLLVISDPKLAPRDTQYVTAQRWSPCYIRNSLLNWNLNDQTSLNTYQIYQVAQAPVQTKSPEEKKIAKQFSC